MNDGKLRAAHLDTDTPASTPQYPLQDASRAYGAHLDECNTCCVVGNELCEEGMKLWREKSTAEAEAREHDPSGWRAAFARADAARVARLERW